MNKLKIIIIREFLNKIRNRTFIRMTFISPLIMVGMGMLIFYVSKKSADKKRVISYLDQSGFFDKKTDFKNTRTISFNDLSDKNLEEAKQIVQKTGQYGLLYIPQGKTPQEVAEGIKFFSEKPPGISFTERVESLLNKRLTELNMKQKNLDIGAYKKAKIQVNLGMETPEGAKTSKTETGIKFGIGSTLAYFLFIFIMVYGSLVMRSVIEEKTGRIIEVIISSVKPFQLMMGKVLGTGAAGILQFIIWVVIIMVLYTISIPLMGIQTGGQHPLAGNMPAQNIPSGKLQMVFDILHSLPMGMILLAFLLFFVGGYLLYSSMFAAVGAAVDNETDTQQFMMPIMMPLMLGIYIGISVAINDPHGSIATAFSLIPFTSPIVMMIRIPLGAPLWQVAFSLIILYVTFILFIWLAGKIYRVGILSYGKKPSYKDLYKWLKYS